MDKTKIHKTADISKNASIGKNTYVWNNAQIRENAIVGNNCIVSKDVYIDKNVKIGNFCKIQNSALIYDGVTIKNNVFIGPGVVFTNDYFPRVDKKNWKIKKTVVEYGASIGANATIICGVKIGKSSMIAAGSVVTRNVGDNELVAGNPAILKKKLKND
jgi:UDP-2-acetamido-3-amino-2,3-dideoxy-glucuronate N-acetyltransferase